MFSSGTGRLPWTGGERRPWLRFVFEIEAVDGFSCRQEDEEIGGVNRNKTWRRVCDGIMWDYVAPVQVEMLKCEKVNDLGRPHPFLTLERR
jgi:hypothetical protein